MSRFFCNRLLFILLLLAATPGYTTPANKGIIPDTLVLDQRWNYDHYTHLVVPTINWLQSTPLTEDKELRTRHNNFLMFWLQKNEDVVVNMPEYLLTFQNASRELYFIYTGGWIKHALETGDRNQVNCAMAAVNAVLDFYSSNMGVPKNDYLDHLLTIRQKGKLPTLFDSSATAQNTYLFLQTPTKKTRFAPDENFFNFRYTGINFTDTRSLKYRYKLEGYYDKWLTTDEEGIIYPNLPPGDYTFTVQASIHPGFTNAVEENYSFRIAAPFYKQPLFIIAIILIFITAAYMYMRKREQRLQQVADLQHDRVVFEYEYLKSQVNPHFLFNSLNTLANLIEEDSEAAVNYTGRLSDLYRNMLAHTDRNIVPLSEELEILENYIHIQKSRFGEALQIILDIPPRVAAEKKIIYLALQLLVENAVKHNIISKAQPLVISIAAKGNELVISNPLQPKLSKEKRNGMGLANISKRYSLITDSTVSYGEENGNYVVRLPLL